MNSARISWSATSLGADFAAYLVQRQHPDGGWNTIARILTEGTGTQTFDDYEARRTVEESYRVLVEDGDGITSVPPSATSVTVSAEGGFVVASNEVVSLNAELPVSTPSDIELPEHAETAYTHGRHGARLYRSTESLGERWQFDTAESGASDAGPELWRTAIERYRDSGVSHLTVLSPWGQRWFCGVLAEGASMTVPHFARLSATLVELGDTPAVVTVT